MNSGDRDKDRRDFNHRKPPGTSSGSKNRAKTKSNESETEGNTKGVVSRDESPEPSVRPKEPGNPSGSVQQPLFQAPAEPGAEPSTRELIAMMTDLKETVTSMFRDYAKETNSKMDTVIADLARLISEWPCWTHNESNRFGV